MHNVLSEDLNRADKTLNKSDSQKSQKEQKEKIQKAWKSRQKDRNAYPQGAEKAEEDQILGKI